MRPSHDNSKSSKLDQATTQLLHELCTKLYDQVITDHELKQLNNFLDANPDARQFYLRYVSLHSLLIGSAGKHQQLESELLGRHIDSTQDSVATPTNSLSQKGDNSSLPAGGITIFPSSGLISSAIALSCIAGVLFSFWMLLPESKTQVTGKAFNQTEPSGVATSDAKATRLSYASSTARWTTPNHTRQSGDVFSPGDTIGLSGGEIELTYRCGTKILLVGPVEFLIDDSGGKLVRGGLVASVTEAGHGFTIEVPNGKVVDLGTEFGVAVDDFGVSEVSVFQGKVEAFPTIGSTNREKVQLFQGDGLQWNLDNVTTHSADLRKFATSALGRQLNITSTDNSATLVDQFREATLSPNWAKLGDVKTSPNGLILKGNHNASDRPYLISQEQFNPLLGPVTVTCDFRFTEIANGVPAALSIMTRGDNGRGVALPPWTGLLASCVRCSFGAKTDSTAGSTVGHLQTGVKLESDRELVNVSWSGFEAPRPNTPYRLVMRDDGVNVSLTVSLLGHSSRNKTVTCRSLFNGKYNHVALESSVAGSTLIERVEINQESTSTTLSNYAEFCSLLQDTPESQAVVRQHLDGLVSKDATLILSDEFSGPNLDDGKWQPLGAVSIESGAVQLGNFNEASHIDTWRARPYLLTKESFDPTDGPLTVTGKITFANNFREGYGASFAIFTRANNQRGSGPGWENSVLQRGVRANFWPASWDKNHSLEIHEKPTANTITLLDTQGVRVDPKSRIYLFRVIDDGHIVRLTIVDPRNPEIDMSISAPTHPDLKNGFIGFESCWGSPIRLDDVRISQSKRANETTQPAAK